MKWRIPQHGETRSRTRFAFLPVKIGTEKIWLERYYRREVCRHYRDIYGEPGSFWETEKIQRYEGEPIDWSWWALTAATGLLTGLLIWSSLVVVPRLWTRDTEPKLAGDDMGAYTNPVTFVHGVTNTTLKALPPGTYELRRVSP